MLQYTYKKPMRFSTGWALFIVFAVLGILSPLCGLEAATIF